MNASLQPKSLHVVYVLTNPAMPGLVKIGYTTQSDANLRIGQLFTTGVPVPFQLEFACKVPNPDEVEKALHLAFAPQRINPRREFFRLEPDQPIAILRLLHVEEATNEVESQPTVVDQESMAAAAQLRSRRPNLNFAEMEIPVGAELHSTHNSDVAVVIGSRKIRYNGEEMSLTAATRLSLGLDYSVAPGPHWTYNGRSIREIYDDTYGEGA